LTLALVLVTLALGASLYFSSIPSVHAAGPWALNVKTVQNDGVTDLSDAKVTMTNSTGPFEITVTCSGYGCWANYTSITNAEVVTVKVQWEGSWVNGTFSETMTADTTVTATCKVYASITPVWKDNTGAALYTEPTAFTWTPPNGTLSGSLAPGTAYTLQNGTTTLNSVTWEGSNVIPAAAYTLDPSAGSPTFNLEVYAVTLVWKDSAGAALYIEPTSFKWTPPNSTLSGNLTPGTAYYLQNGTTTISAVTWEASDVTPAVATFDANVGATFNLKVYDLTLSFKDTSGAGLYTPVTSYDIQYPNSTLTTGQTAATWTQVQTGTITLTNVLWEGSHVTNATNTYSLTSTSTWTMNLKVFSITPVWKDSAGNALYVEPTHYHFTYPNGTTNDKTPGVAYSIQNGTTTVSTVLWEGTNVTPVVATFSPESGSPTFNLKVYSITPIWKTSTGTALIAEPTSYKMTDPNGTLSGALSAGVAYQIANGTVTLSAVTWYTTDVTPTSATFIPSDGSPTKNLKVYSITPVWKTSAGAALIAEPTSFKWTSPNGTLTGALSVATAYQVANGTVTLSAVTWYGTDVTPASATFVPSDGSPTKNLKVYSITPVWKTSTGVALYTEPTSFKWTPPNGTLSGALTPGSTYQVQNGTVTLSAVTWEGSNVTPSSGMTFVPSSGSPTKNLKVYSITPLWRDTLGTSNVAVTSFKWTPANTTLSGTLLEATAYWLQNGTTTVSVVMHGGQDITPTSPTFDASSGSPTFTTTFAIGSGGGGLPPATTTPATTVQSIQLTLHIIPDYSLSLLSPRANVEAEVAVSNTGTSTRNMNVHYLVTNTATGTIAYENTFDTTVPQGGTTLTFTVPVSKDGTYSFLIEVKNLQDGKLTTTTQQASVGLMDVWQAPLIVWGAIGGVATVVILAVVFARDSILAAIAQIRP